MDKTSMFLTMVAIYIAPSIREEFRVVMAGLCLVAAVATMVFK